MAIGPQGQTSAFYCETLAIDNTAGGVGCSSNAYSSSTGVAVLAVMGPLEGGPVRYLYCATSLATVTSASGHLLSVGESLVLRGNDHIRNFRAIRVTASNGALPITYERNPL